MTTGPSVVAYDVPRRGSVVTMVPTVANGMTPVTVVAAITVMTIIAVMATVAMPVTVMPVMVTMTAVVVGLAGAVMVVMTLTAVVTLGGKGEAAGEQGHCNECAMDDFHHGLPVSDAADTMLAATSSKSSVGTGG